MTEQEAQQAFGCLAVKFQCDGEKKRLSWQDQETNEQAIVRMTLGYIQEGLMDWESATIFLNGVINPEEELQ